MKAIFRVIKSIFFWRYARNTWQWDALCALILVFIFLTPKSWFETGELHNASSHPTHVASTLIISSDLVDDQRDKEEIENRVRAITGDADTQVTAIRQRRDATGKTIALEVDIR